MPGSHFNVLYKMIILPGVTKVSLKAAPVCREWSGLMTDKTKLCLHNGGHNE